MDRARTDFFVSYTAVDEQWAVWIAGVLEGAGYRVTIQAWDFRPGNNFVIEMQRALQSSDRMIAVLSPDYLAARYPQPEWAAVFAADPEGTDRRIVPVMVRDCQPDGLLGQVVQIRVHTLDRAAAERALLEGVKPGRAKPTERPAFPGVTVQAPTDTMEPGFGNVAELTAYLGAAVRNGRDRDAQVRLAHELDRWARGDSSTSAMVFAPERLLRGIVKARTISKELERRLPTVVSQKYAVERGYDSARAFTLPGAMFVFFNDVQAQNKFASDVVEALWNVVIDRTVTAVLLAHTPHGDDYLAPFLDSHIRAYQEGRVIEQLGLHWVGLEPNEPTVRYDIFRDGLSFWTTMPDRVIGLVDFMRDNDGGLPPFAMVEPAPLISELVDEAAWWLALMPQALALQAVYLPVLGEEEAVRRVDQVLDYEPFRVGRH